MILTNFDDASFFEQMSNIVKYAEGYLEGVQLGKQSLLSKMGKTIKEILDEYIDTSARVDPSKLHHVYEWYQTGSPNARLFNITYEISNGGLTFGSTFTQSRSFSNGSMTPFYDKAYIMENGISVIIKPSRSGGVLAFEDNGETIFTKSPIKVNAPGGRNVQGSFAETINQFFERYFTQSYLAESGFTRYLESPVDFKNNLSKAKTGGKSAGKEIGYNWIIKAGDRL